MAVIVVWMTPGTLECNYCGGLGPNPTPMVALRELARGFGPPGVVHTSWCAMEPNRSEKHLNGVGHYLITGPRS